MAEVEIVLKHLKSCVEPLLGERGEKHLADLEAQSAKRPSATYLRTKIADAQALACQGTKMLKTLTAWRDLAQSKTLSDPIDPDALKSLFDERAAMADQLKHNIATILKDGAHEALWHQIEHGALDHLQTDTPD